MRLATVALAGGTLLAGADACLAQAASKTTVSQLLKDGYEIKTAFFATGGGAYIVLQRSTSAYMCHSAPQQTCEKLN